MSKSMTIRITLIAAALVLLSIGSVTAAVNSSQFPVPSVRDQITHDRGNIATTVDNWGYIGGYSYAGRPSGRWPANSEHDYLAEMRFWIGGINDAGDTIVANTYDDFNPILSQISGIETYDIRLSTDTTRFEFDPTDTVGTGIGFPAEGWRVWDVETAQWVYNDVYNIPDATFYPGGPVSVQESICRFADDATGTSIMGIEITQTIRQWNYEYNRDMIFFTFEITNAGNENYHDLAVGLYCDFDIGGDDPATGENGRLGDLVAFDSDLDLAWTYDEDGYDPGWGPSVFTGVIGTVILATPNDIPMTSFNTDQWEFLPTTDAGRYDLIDNTDWDESLPPTDQFYIQSVRGIDLPAGETIQLDFALVAAPNEEYLKTTAARARSLFQTNYIGAKAPNESNVKASVGDRQVRLYWDTAAEVSIEPLSGEMDFEGYKLFRSNDRGKTWGTIVTNPDYSLGPDYYPIARFEKDTANPFNEIAHTFVDSNLTNGLEYWYAVIAFDSGTSDFGYPPQENSLATPETADNVIRVIPRDNPLEYQTPHASIEHEYVGNGKPAHDAVTVYIVDEAQITGDEYEIGFGVDCNIPTWNLVNITTGDTLVADRDQLYDQYFNYPIIDGMQVIVKNEFREAEAYQSVYATSSDTTLVPVFVEDINGSLCDEHYRHDFEIRFTETGSVAYEWYTDAPIDVPFELWNITTNTQVGCWVIDWESDGEWTIYDEDFIILTDFDYNDGAYIGESVWDYMNWYLELDPDKIPVTGDVLTIVGAGLVSEDDTFRFSSHKIVSAQARNGLDNIRVVPNPYVGNSEWEYAVGQRQIQFVNLPSECTIRIYTLAGELLRTIDHDNGTGAENWDMLSESGRGIAAGVYFYHIESPYGEHTDKFAVIK